MAFGTQGEAFYLAPARISVAFNEGERRALKAMRAKIRDPQGHEQFVKSMQLASTRRVSAAKKRKVSLAPVAFQSDE